MAKKDEPTVNDRLEGRAPNLDDATRTVDGRKKNPKRFQDWGDLGDEHIVTRAPDADD